MDKGWKSVLRLDKNSAGRDFACGDIHGCFDDLERELWKLRFDKAADRLFCVGDLIDRGPSSELVADYLNSPWFFSVMGNHELMFLMANRDTPERHSYFHSHFLNGGEWAYGMPKQKYDAIQATVQKLPLVIRVGNAIVVHAALPAVESLGEIEKDPAPYTETILWFRGRYPAVNVPGIERIYAGHSILEKPERTGKYVNIDTGAFLRHWGERGKLTVLEIGKDD